MSVCQEILVELASENKKIFSLNTDSVIAKLGALARAVARDANQSPSTIATLAIQIPNLVSELELRQLDDLWRSFRLCGNSLAIETENIPKYWYTLIIIIVISKCYFSREHITFH